MVFQPFDAERGIIVSPSGLDRMFHYNRDHSEKAIGGVRRGVFLCYDLADVSNFHSGRIIIAIALAEAFEDISINPCGAIS